MGKMAQTDRELRQLHKVLRCMSGESDTRLWEIEDGELQISRMTPDGTYGRAIALNFDDAVEALGDMLGIKDPTPLEVAAKEARHAETKRQEYIDKHPHCMSGNARGPKEVEGPTFDFDDGSTISFSDKDDSMAYYRNGDHVIKVKIPVDERVAKKEQI